MAGSATVVLGATVVVGAIVVVVVVVDVVVVLVVVVVDVDEVGQQGEPRWSRQCRRRAAAGCEKQPADDEQGEVRRIMTVIMSESGPRSADLTVRQRLRPIRGESTRFSPRATSAGSGAVAVTNQSGASDVRHRDRHDHDRSQLETIILEEQHHQQYRHERETQHRDGRQQRCPWRPRHDREACRQVRNNAMPPTAPMNMPGIIGPPRKLVSAAL